MRKLQRQLRDVKEDFATLQQKEMEVDREWTVFLQTPCFTNFLLFKVHAKKNEIEKQLELSEAETLTAKNDLKLALKRIDDLQAAINGEIDSESDSLNR